MKIERRLFIDVRSHWSWVCVLAEKFEMAGWKVMFRPELNAIDVLKYRYDGHEIKDDMEEVLKVVDSQKGRIRVAYDKVDDEKMVRWIE